MKLAASYQFEAIGTHWVIETALPLTEAEKAQLHKTIVDFTAVYSRFRTDSLVSHVRASVPGSFDFPPSITALYDVYAKLEEATNGRVNPLIGEALERLGYDAAYSLAPKAGSPFVPPSFTSTVQLKGTTLTFAQPALLDVGAAGKGYLVDELAQILAANHDEYVVDASGDIAVHTKSPDAIGLEHPLNSSLVIGEVGLKNASICASAPNRRTWGSGLHHIIDATTGLPADVDVLATWAVTNTACIVDALATGLFFTPAARLQRMFGDFYYVIMRKNGTIEHNIHSIGRIFT